MVKEGQIVKKGDLSPQIDDAIPQAEKRKATAERNAAKEKADSDVDIRYATAAADVAKYEYLKNKEAYDTVKNAVPWVEVKRLELAWQRAVLQIEQSQVERRINKLTVETKAAEVDAAEEGIRASPDQIAARRGRRAGDAARRRMGQAGRHGHAHRADGSPAGRRIPEILENSRRKMFAIAR